MEEPKSDCSLGVSQRSPFAATKGSLHHHRPLEQHTVNVYSFTASHVDCGPGCHSIPALTHLCDNQQKQTTELNVHKQKTQEPSEPPGVQKRYLLDLRDNHMIPDFLRVVVVV